MNVVYNINNELFRADLQLDSLRCSVTINAKYGKNYKSYERTILYDENGMGFFTWNKRKVYIDSYNKHTMDYIAKKIEKEIPNQLKQYSYSDRISESELAVAIIRDGVHNVRFFYDGTIYKVREGFNRSIIEMFKITLVDAKTGGMNSIKDTYTNDIISLLYCRDCIKIMTSVGDFKRDHTREYMMAFIKHNVELNELLI